MGGINLAETIVKNHLIAGDLNLYSNETASNLAEMDKYMDLLHRVLKIMHDVSPPGPVKTTLSGFLNLQKLIAVFTFIEWYSEQKGFPNFLGDGDLIVPLNSQLAGLNTTSNTVKVFPNSGFLNAMHTRITDRSDVGNHVKKLLNSPIESALFADVILSTPNTSVNGALKTSETHENVLISSYDTTKVKITSPIANSVLFTDSTVNIQFILKDTVGLAYIDIDFQGQTNTSVSRNSNQTISTQVDPSFIGSQLVAVTAVYNRDSVTEYHTDSLTVNVQSDGELLDFRVEPKVADIRKNEPFYPQYTIVYSTSIAGLPNNNPDIVVTIADASVVKYDTTLHAFISLLDSGSTYAVVQYKGFVDTVFIYLNTPEISNVQNECPGGNILFIAGVIDNNLSYQWQVNTGNGFTNISDNGVYSGTTTDSLKLTNPSTSLYGYKYQCIVSGTDGSVVSPLFTLKFVDTWTGAIDTVWNNPANWSCGAVPDGNTDVIINSGVQKFPVINSNASCRSLTANPGSMIKVEMGYNLNITGK